MEITTSIMMVIGSFMIIGSANFLIGYFIGKNAAEGEYKDRRIDDLTELINYHHQMKVENIIRENKATAKRLMQNDDTGEPHTPQSTVMKHPTPEEVRKQKEKEIMDLQYGILEVKRNGGSARLEELGQKV